MSVLRAFLDASPALALVEVTKALGSTPREAGAWMLVSPARTFGTIGGGQLEFLAIDKARQAMPERLSPLEGEMAAKRPEGGAPEGTTGAAAATPPLGSPRGGRDALALSIPLGPEIGQCCGGRVELAITLVDEARRAELLARAEAEAAARPHVYLFGGGHVGHALASYFALLPVSVTVVETRAEALDDMPSTVATLLTPVPEQAVRDAPSGSAFVVLTHDHALDFLIVAEALKRTDAAYVGMIGSKTKKETFRRWYLREAGGTGADFARLVSPIGGSAVRDKRPSVIAALAAAEIVAALLD